MITTKEALLYASMPEHKALVRRTQGFIRWALDRVTAPYVACSFGKDSAALLHMVRLEKPNVPVIYVEYEESNLIDNYEEVISMWDLTDLRRLFVSCNSIDDEVNERDVIPIYAKSKGFDSGFVGIRASESNGRRITLRQSGMFYKSLTGVTRICPLADWTDWNSAAYCISNNLPTLSTYIHYGFDSRTVNGLSSGDFSFRENQLRALKNRDMPKFNLLISKYPTLSRYV